MPKSMQDQIKDLENTRAAKVARMEEVTQKSIEEERAMDEAETEEFDGLDAEVRSIDSDLERLHKLQRLTAQKAVQATGVKTVGEGSDARGGKAPAIIVNREVEDKFKGQSFTRMVIAKALAYQEGASAVAIAQKRWGRTNPLLVEVIRATVEGGGSGSGEWGAELVSADNRFTGDFIEFLNSITVFDKIPFREVPANVSIKGQDGAATGYWVGESKHIPLSAQSFSSTSLTPLKVAALAVVSNELLRDSTPAAERLVRDALAEASAQRIDNTLFSTAAASAGVSPAGLLNGVTAKNSSGADEEGLREDIKNLYAEFITAKNASDLWFVMSPSLAKTIQLMRTSLGLRSFEGITANGGTLEGDPVATGHNINSNHLILLKPSEIYKIGDGGVQVSVSRDASVQMLDNPTQDSQAGTPTTSVSMFATESTAIKVVRSINFAKRRTHAVQYVEDADYGLGAS